MPVGGRSTRCRFRGGKVHAARGGEGDLGAGRGGAGAIQRFLADRYGHGSHHGQGIDGTLAERRAILANRRRAHDRQGHRLGQGPRHPLWQPHDIDRAMRAGRAVGQTAARRWRNPHRLDHNSRVRLEGYHRKPLDRGHAQSLESANHARRLIGRRRGRGGGRRRGTAHRHRRRRIGPHSIIVHRRLRPRQFASTGMREQRTASPRCRKTW